MSEPISLEAFPVTYNGKQYNCTPIDRNGQMLYQINFNNGYSYLAQSSNRDGEIFWTAIPQDMKLKNVVHELGKQIELHFL